MKVDGIILAAGLSTRTGESYKMTLNVYGKCVIEKCIENMYDSCSKIIVVGGHRIDDITNILSKYSKVKVVFNSNYKSGMFSSVQEGLRHVNENRFFLTPGDYPLINQTTYKSMLNIESDIVIPRYNKRKGHPILIKSSFIEDILKNTKYESLRCFVKSQGFTPLDVSDPGILIDLDTMEDYSRIIDKVACK